MSRPRLPPELLDNVVDFLHDSRNTFKSCCLVSKSWIPRTRKYLFADIKFRFLEDLQLWELAFPDPSISPACCAKTLAIGSPQVIAAAAGGGGWVLAFSRVVHLTINTLETDSEPIAISLIPFHGFSPVLKSLRVVSATLTLSQTFDLIRSFPLLEDLSTYIDVDDPTENYGFDKQPAITQPSPAFTGSLELFSPIGTDPFVPRLLALPNGLRFRNLDLTWYRDGDPSSTSALVEECCSTLERLKIDAKVGTMGTSVLRACRHEWLIFFYSLSAFSTRQPRQCNETRGLNLYMLAASKLDSQDTPNRHTEAQKTRMGHVEHACLARPPRGC